MSLPAHIQSYLNALNVTEATPTLELAEKLQRKHLATFSFNSVAVLLERSFTLEIKDIIEKIVVQKLGGYCFEHNKLMFEALKALGFNVRLLIAKVLNNHDIDSPRTHRITLLELEGSQYLVDVGFGASCIRNPLKIEVGLESAQDHLTYRVVLNKNKDFQLELSKPEGYFSLYAFNFNNYTEADCMMGNFYSCQHPKAVFVNNLVVARILPKETRSLINMNYQKIGISETIPTEVTTAQQLGQILLEDFELDLTASECDLIFQKTCVH